MAPLAPANNALQQTGGGGGAHDGHCCRARIIKSRRPQLNAVLAGQEVGSDGGVEYGLGLPDAYRLAAAALYDEAFSQKLGSIIRDRQRCRAVLAESLHQDLAIVAIENDHLVGLAGFHLAGRSFTGGGTLSTLVRHLGLGRALWAAILIPILERKPRPGELLMDGVVVDASARGRGIGGALLDRVVSYARERSLTSVRLDVVDSNPRARRLYERKGFVEVRTTRTPYLRSFMGFAAVATLAKEVG